jgi:hypothetical protein
MARVLLVAKRETKGKLARGKGSGQRRTVGSSLAHSCKRWRLVALGEAAAVLVCD